MFAVNALNYACNATYCLLVWVAPHVNRDIHARKFLLPKKLSFGEIGLSQTQYKYVPQNHNSLATELAKLTKNATFSGNPTF